MKKVKIFGFKLKPNMEKRKLMEENITNHMFLQNKVLQKYMKFTLMDRYMMLIQRY